MGAGKCERVERVKGKEGRIVKKNSKRSSAGTTKKKKVCRHIKKTPSGDFKLLWGSKSKKIRKNNKETLQEEKGRTLKSS